MAVKLQPKTISQRKMARYMELKVFKAEFDELEKEIKDLAKTGVPCQPGRFGCMIKTSLTTSVSWKTEFILAVSQVAADKIMEERKGNSSRSSLVVVDRDNPVV